MPSVGAGDPVGVSGPPRPRPRRRPFALARSYPRIAERLALSDVDTAIAIRYLDSLTIDDRGDREGFPVDVARELMRLRIHYAQRLEGEIGSDR